MTNALYWAHTANNVYTTICDCHSCAQNRAHGKRQWKPKLFSPEGPLEYIWMDIPGPKPRIKQSNQFIVVMADCYTMLTKGIRATVKSANTVARITFEPCVANSGFLSKLHANNDSQLVSKFLVGARSTLGENNISTTDYYPQTNIKVEIFNCTLVLRHCYYLP